jgi:HTH-type transcriptional regulator/antitoxin HigA
MRIQPVRTEAEHDAAVARITQLMGAELGTAASDELEVLVTLVDAYETKHFPMDTTDPVTIIKFQMEQQGLTRKDLEPMIGSRARVSEILTGKRALTLPMIRRLHVDLGIPVDLLVGAGPASHRTVRHNRRKLPVAVSRTGRALAAQQIGR